MPDPIPLHLVSGRSEYRPVADLLTSLLAQIGTEEAPGARAIVVLAVPAGDDVAVHVSMAGTAKVEAMGLLALAQQHIMEPTA